MKNKRMLKVLSTSFLLGSLVITSPSFAQIVNDDKGVNTFNHVDGLQLGDVNVNPSVKATSTMPNRFKSPLILNDFDGSFDFNTWFINNYVPATGYKDTYNNYDQVRAYTIYSFRLPEKDSLGRNKRFQVIFGVDLFHEGTGTNYEDMHESKRTDGNNAFYKYSQATGDLGHIYYKGKMKYNVDNAIKAVLMENAVTSDRNIDFNAGMMFNLSNKFTKPTIIPSHGETFITKEQYIKDHKAIEKAVLDKYIAKYGKDYDTIYTVQVPDDYNGIKNITLPSNFSDNFRTTLGGFQIVNRTLFDDESDDTINEAVVISHGKYTPYDGRFMLLTDGVYKGSADLPYKQIKKNTSGKKQLMEFNEFFDGKVENQESLKRLKTDIMKLVNSSKVTLDPLYTYVGNVEKTTKETPYKTIKQNDPTLKAGETKVKVEGVKGKTEFLKTYEVDRSTGKLSNPKESSKVVSKPVDEIVLIGTMKAETKEEKKTETIAFEKETRNNPKLKKGETKVVQKGVNGTKEITYKVTLENGKEVNREKVSEKITKEPVKEIVEVGTLETTTKEEKKTETVLFEKETRNNPQLKKGETKVVQKGVNGTKEITYKVTLENGKEVKREKVSEKVIKEPVKEIVEVGTLVSEVKEEKKTEDIKFKTIFKENPELKKDEKKVVTKGENGKLTVFYKVTYENGKEVKREKYYEEVSKEKVDEVIEVGTLVVETKDEEKSEVIAFEKETKENPELKKGETKVIQKGENGEKTVKYKVTYNNDKEVSREKISEKITKEPVKEITEVGTKVSETKEVKEVEDIKFETITRENKNAPKGEVKVVQKGAKGKKEITYKVVYENGKEVSREKVSEQVVQDVLNEVIEVGTKEQVKKQEPKKETKQEKQVEKIEQTKKPEPKNLPKAGVEAEAPLLAGSLLSVFSGLFISLKKKFK